MSRPQITMTPADEAEVDHFWANPPQRPALDLSAIVPFGAVRVAITCRACEKRDEVIFDNGQLIVLCRDCRADLAATRAKIAQARDEIAALQAAALARYQDYCQDMTDDLRERWENLIGLRIAAQGRLERALRGKFPSGTTPETMQRLTDEAQQAWDLLQARIAKTRANPANPLAEVLEVEEAYLASVRGLQAMHAKLEIALQEVAAAGGELPF